MGSEYTQVRESPYYSDRWFSGTEHDPDVDLTYNMTLEKLRLTSSRMLKNDYITEGISEALINFTLGEGIRFRYSKSKKVEKQINKLFEKVDKERFNSLADIAEQLLSASFERGDILVNMVYTPYVGSNYKTSIELVEAGRIKTPPSFRKDRNVVNGVRKNSHGCVVGYYVRKLMTKWSDPNNSMSERDSDFTYLPAYNKKGRRVCWLFSMKHKKFDQTRAIPKTTQVMNLARYRGDYLDATLIQARVSASFTAFIHSKNPKGTQKNLENSNQGSLQKVGELRAGQILSMGLSDKVDFASPSRPSDNTDQFIQRLNRLECMPYRIPYEFIFMDLSTVNYTSFKAGMGEVKKTVGRIQRPLSKTLNMIMGFFIREAKVLGILPKKLGEDDIRIIYPKVEVIDEEKLARAFNININKNQASSRQDICDVTGNDYEIVKDELDQEALDIVDRQGKILLRQKELEEKYGIRFTPDDVDSEGFDNTSETNKEQRKEDGNY